MPEIEIKLHEAIEKHSHLSTYPVGVKLAACADQAPTKAKYPLRHIGNRVTLCQGVTISRTLGWTVAFRKEDHGCPLARVFLGHISPDKYLTGAIAGSYQPDEACACIMEASIPRLPPGSVEEVWLSPLSRCEFEPDLTLAYGNPGQILTLVHAANFRKGTGVRSLSMGRVGCATWTAGVLQSGECTYMIPGSGERVFAGTQDHEMSFAIPRSRFQDIIEGLEYIGKHKPYQYPVPNLAILSKPRIPESYFSIDPEWEE